MRLRGDRSPSPGRKSGEREDLCAAGLATRGRLPDIRNVAVLDAAVAAAYGWPLSITDENALREALALNGRSSVTRAAEESSMPVWWWPAGTQIGSVRACGTS